jgi:ribonuclease HI
MGPILQGVSRGGDCALDRLDELQWIGGDKSRCISVKNIYGALATKFWLQKSLGWRRTMWKWDLALKIKLFIWLAVENKILTWDNLQGRGWEGPNICYLCFKEPESVNHLLNTCPFTQKVWQRILSGLNLRTTWGGSTIIDCFDCWIKKEPKFHNLPCIICWNIWLEHNRTIFENVCPSIHSIVYKTLGGMIMINPAKTTHTLRSSKSPHFSLGVVGWFDGATLSNDQQSGAGGLIKTSENIVYKWTYNCGTGTNTREKLLGVWATLTLARRLHIVDMQVLGDSKIIIDWLNDKGNLQVNALECWKDRIRELHSSFSSIKYTHIYRESNMEVDKLSKKALLKPEGKINFNLWTEGQEGPTLFLNLI